MGAHQQRGGRLQVRGDRRVLYAVLLAFVVIITWGRFYDAEKALAVEAGSAATLYRLSGGLDETSAAQLRSDGTRG